MIKSRHFFSFVLLAFILPHDGDTSSLIKVVDVDRPKSYRTAFVKRQQQQQQNADCNGTVDTSPDFLWRLLNRAKGQYLSYAGCSSASDDACKVVKSDKLDSAKPWQFTGISHHPDIYQIKTANRASCLGANSNGEIFMARCCGIPSQRWEYIGRKDFEAYKNVATGQFLDASNPDQRANTGTQQDPGNGYQLWIGLHEQPLPNDRTENHWYLFNSETQQFLTPPSCTTTRCPVEKAPTEASSKPWQLTHLWHHSDAYLLQTTDRKYCLDAETSDAKVGKVFVSPCNRDAPTQQWRRILYDAQSRHVHAFQNIATGQYLDADTPKRPIYTNAVHFAGNTYMAWKEITAA